MIGVFSKSKGIFELQRFSDAPGQILYNFTYSFCKTIEN